MSVKDRAISSLVDVFESNERLAKGKLHSSDFNEATEAIKLRSGTESGQAGLITVQELMGLAAKKLRTDSDEKPKSLEQQVLPQGTLITKLAAKTSGKQIQKMIQDLSLRCQELGKLLLQSETDSQYWTKSLKVTRLLANKANLERSLLEVKATVISNPNADGLKTTDGMPSSETDVNLVKEKLSSLEAQLASVKKEIQDLENDVQTSLLQSKEEIGLKESDTKERIGELNRLIEDIEFQEELTGEITDELKAENSLFTLIQEIPKFAIALRDKENEIFKTREQTMILHTALQQAIFDLASKSPKDSTPKALKTQNIIQGLPETRISLPIKDVQQLTQDLVDFSTILADTITVQQLALETNINDHPLETTQSEHPRDVKKLQYAESQTTLEGMRKDLATRLSILNQRLLKNQSEQKSPEPHQVQLQDTEQSKLPEEIVKTLGGIKASNISLEAMSPSVQEDTPSEVLAGTTTVSLQAWVELNRNKLVELAARLSQMLARSEQLFSSEVAWSPDLPVQLTKSRARSSHLTRLT